MASCLPRQARVRSFPLTGRVCRFSVRGSGGVLRTEQEAEIGKHAWWSGLIQLAIPPAVTSLDRGELKTGYTGKYEKSNIANQTK